MIRSFFNRLMWVYMALSFDDLTSYMYYNVGGSNIFWGRKPELESVILLFGKLSCSTSLLYLAEYRCK